jgi:hypothetical protein
MVGGQRLSDCGVLHADDVPCQQPPPRWRRWRRRAALDERDRALPWPAVGPPSREERNSRLAERDAFTVPDAADCEETIRRTLARVLQATGEAIAEQQSVRRLPRRDRGTVHRHEAAGVRDDCDDGDDAELLAMCWELWHRHSGFGPKPDAGELRYAAAALFPDAAPPRDCDARSLRHEQLVGFLAAHDACTQGLLALLGLHSLTLYRGFHVAWNEPISCEPLAALHRGIERGAVRPQDPEDPERLSGTVIVPAVVSTLDGWSTLRSYGRWRRPGSAWRW